MAISEKIELLGKGLYKNIPDTLTLKSIPTGSELDYVGREDFQETMLDIIFPKAIEEQINFRELLEIDFQWICRCLRILNYGPYYTTNSLYCSTCDEVSSGEYQVDLRNIDVKPLPADFTNSLTISKDEFIDFNGEITIHLLTIQEAMNAAKDTLFADSNGDINIQFARLCYMISSIGGNSKIAVPERKFQIQNKLSSADFMLLKSKVHELTDYGLRAGGRSVCPKCHSKEAAFIALPDERFFRPTVGDLRSWKADRLAENSGKPSIAAGEGRGRDENISTNEAAEIRKDN